MGGWTIAGRREEQGTMFSFTSFLLQSDSFFKNRVPALLKKKKKHRILNIFKSRICSAVHPKGCWTISNTLRRVISWLSPYKTSGVKCTPRAVLCSSPKARARRRCGRKPHTAGSAVAHAGFATRVRRRLHSAHAPSARALSSRKLAGGRLNGSQAAGVWQKPRGKGSK